MTQTAHNVPVEVRARIALTVGVSGHRTFKDDATKAAISVTYVKVLAALGQAVCAERGRLHPEYLEEEPVLRLLSALAEGTDRFAVYALEQAEARLSRDGPRFEGQLVVVLPFSSDLYKEDFCTPDGRPDLGSIAEFEHLLKRAGTRVRVMPGSRKDRDARLRAYEAAGRFVIDHSDLMIVVFDKERAQSRGGTRQMYGEALRWGVPVVLIDPEKPGEFSIQVKGVRSQIQDLSSLVARILRLPARGQSQPVDRPRFLGLERFPLEGVEKALALVYRIPWRLLMTLSFAWRRHAPGARSRRSIELSGLLRESKQGPGPEQGSTPVRDPFDTTYRYAQRLAGRYATLYRGAFLINYVLGAGAVTCAMFALVDRSREVPWVVTEVIILTLMLLNFWMNRYFDWRRRFLDWRFLAEEFRQIRVLHAIGMVPPTAHPVILQSTGHPHDTWMDRCFRSWVRQIGPATDAVAPAYWIVTIRAKWIVGQTEYHMDRAWRLEGAERMLQHLAYACFVMAFIGCAGHLAHYVAPGLPLSHWLSDRSLWLTFLAAGMPAWGAACHASAVQGEFLRLIERSKDVITRLETAGAEFDRLEKEASSVEELRAETLAIAQFMLDEVTDWHIVHQGPEFIPG